MKKFMMILTLAVAYFAATATAGAIPPPRMRTPLPLGPLAATGLEAGSDGSIAAPCISCDSDDARIAARHQQC